MTPRVLQVVHGYPPSDIGGVEWHVKNLSEGLAARGLDVRVFAGSPDLGVAEEDALVSAIPVSRVRRTERGDPRLVTSDSRVESRFVEVLRSWRPHVVHVHHLLFLSLRLPALARQDGIPVVMTVHDLWLLSHDFRPRIPLLRKPAVRASHALGRELRHPRAFWGSAACALPRASIAQDCLRSSDWTITPSVFVRDVVVGAGVDPARLSVIPHGVAPGALREARVPGVLTLLMAGSLVRNKGLHVLLEALRGLDADDRARVVTKVWGQEGDPAYATAVRSLALGLDVRFGGAYAHDQLDEVYRGVDLLVLPALWDETYSLVVREARVRGIPALVSDRGALPEAVSTGGGAVFRSGDSRALRSIIKRVLDDPGLRDGWVRSLPMVPTSADGCASVVGVYRSVSSSAEWDS